MRGASEKLDRRCLQELKSLAKPPAGIPSVCSAVGCLLGLRVQEWKHAQHMMRNPQAFVLQVKGADVDSISQASLVKVAAMAREPFFSVDCMKCKSQAAADLVDWVLKVLEYRSIPRKAMVIEVTPALAEEVATDCEAAVEAIGRLTKAHITELKCLAKPPAGVRLTLEAVCVLLGEQPVKKRDPTSPQKYTLDFWEASKRMLSDMGFLQRLHGFRDESVTSHTLSAVEPYLRRPDFHPDLIKKASIACEAMCFWVRAMHKHHLAKALLKSAVAGNSEESAGEPEKALAADIDLVEADTTVPSSLCSPSSSDTASASAAATPPLKMCKADAVELKGLSKPPQPVMLVCAVTRQLLAGIDPNVIVDDEGAVEDGGWKASKQMLGDARFLSNLLSVKEAIDRGALPPANVELTRAMQRRLMGDDFRPDVVAKVSKAAAGLCAWVLDMCRYYDETMASGTPPAGPAAAGA